MEYVLKNKVVINDVSIKSPSEDLLERRYFAYYLAKAILNLNNKDNSYVIGILGRWGDGKTSTINMALEYLDMLSQHSDYGIDDLDKGKKETSPDEEKCTKKEKSNKKTIILTALNVIVSLLGFGGFLVFVYIVSRFVFYQYMNYHLLVGFILLALLLYYLTEKTLARFLQFEIFQVQIINPFKNLNKKFENKKKYIPIWFEAWNYSSKDKILEEFFKTVSQELNTSSDVCLSKVIKLIAVYSKLICNLDISFLETIFSDESIVNLKEEIKKCFENCQQKLVIVIDDIDRLLPDEELLIFQIVKMLADFPNIVYLLAFDKNKVCNDISKTYHFDGNDYLKKIIQVEKTLPVVDNRILEKIFLLEIKQIVEENGTYNEEELRNAYNFAYKDIYIKNLRDLYKFFNTFKFMYSAIKDESLYLLDILSISMIEVFENDLYNYVLTNKKIFCSKSIWVDNLGTVFIHLANNEKSENFNEIAKKILSFKNLNILQILFPLLFKEIFDEIQAIKNQKKPVATEFQNLCDKINYVKIEKNFIPTGKNSQISDFTYRRLCNYLYFENYFRFNVMGTIASDSEIKTLLNKLDNTSEFNNELFKLYNSEPDKISDFIGYWNSNFNKKVRTNKKNLLNLIRNLLSLSLEQVNLIDYMQNLNVFANVSRFWIKEFNENENDVSNKITLNDVYDAVSSSIEFLNTNLYFFICFVLWQYKFPLNDMPNLKTLDTNNTFSKVVKLINGNIEKAAIISSKYGMSILDYLYSYLDSKQYVLDLITEILNEEDVWDLLNLLLTAKNLNLYVFSSDYGSIKPFFAKVEKEQELKEKLLNLYLSPRYEQYKNSEEYNARDRYGESCIVEVVLNLYYGTLITQIKTKARINDNINDETKLISLKEQLGLYSEEELKYAIHSTETETQSKESIKAELVNIKGRSGNLYSKYYIEKFDLFLS